MSNYEIVKASIEDIDEIDKCNRRNLPENYDKETIKKVIENEFSANYVVRVNSNIVNNNIIGYILSWIQVDKYGQQTGHIISIAIDEEYRRQHIGDKLLETVEQELKKINHRLMYMSLNVRCKNTKAYKFYSKHHYSRIKKNKDFYGKNQHGYFMKKNLF